MKKIYLIVAVFLFFSPFITSAGSLDLKTTPEKIYDYKIIQKEVKYFYTTYAIAPQNDEILSLRTANSQTFPLPNYKLKTRIYPGQPFKKIDNTWFQTEVATTTLEAWNIQTKPTVLEKLKNWFLSTALADTFYSGSGNGTVRNNDATTWASRRDAANGTNLTPGSSDYMVSGPAGNLLWRAFLPFEITIEAGATINSATLNLYDDGGSSGEAGHSYALIETSQADTSQVQLSDYSALTLNSPDEGAARISDWAANQYNTFTLNATGLSWLPLNGWAKLGVRNGDYDVDNSDPAGSSHTIEFYPSDHTGTANDPYLDITWTPGEEPPPAEINIATTTDMNIENITYIATTTAINASTTLTVGEYKIPAILYFLVLTVFCFTILTVYFLYILNQKE